MPPPCGGGGIISSSCSSGYGARVRRYRLHTQRLGTARPEQYHSAPITHAFVVYQAVGTSRLLSGLPQRSTRCLGKKQTTFIFTITSGGKCRPIFIFFSLLNSETMGKEAGVKTTTKTAHFVYGMLYTGIYN